MFMVDTRNTISCLKITKPKKINKHFKSVFDEIYKKKIYFLINTNKLKIRNNFISILKSSDIYHYV